VCFQFAVLQFADDNHDRHDVTTTTFKRNRHLRTSYIKYRLSDVKKQKNCE